MNLNNHIEKILVTNEQIEARCKELALEIDKDYADKKPILLSLLRGSIPFVAALSKYITIPVEFDYMKASSYRGGTQSTGNVAITVLPASKLEGRHVIVVEDIVDSGRTLSYLLELLEQRGPKSLSLCTLLDKPERRVIDVKVDYTGFQIPDEFVVGYGLDYDQRYRNLPYIGVVELD